MCYGCPPHSTVSLRQSVNYPYKTGTHSGDRLAALMTIEFSQFSKFGIGFLSCLCHEGRGLRVAPI